METWIESLIAGLGWEILSGVIGAVIMAVLGFIFPFRRLRARIEQLEATQQAPAHNQPEPVTSSEEGVMYIEACGIVRAYIEPALQDTLERIQPIIIHDFVERFSETTGAMLGPGQYNRQRLRQWIESNAARFLVDHRGAMR